MVNFLGYARILCSRGSHTGWGLVSNWGIPPDRLQPMLEPLDFIDRLAHIETVITQCS